MADAHARFEEIYDHYAALILAYAARRVTAAEDAADVLADTFTVAWRRIDEVPAGEAARPWLYAVARRCLGNQRRARRRRERLEARLAAQITTVVANSTTHRPLLDGELVTAFNKLSANDREILTLLAWDGLGRDDIATVMGWSRARVRLRLHRARTRLLRLLGTPVADDAATPDGAATPSAPTRELS